jgi:hypothetical protein
MLGVGEQEDEIHHALKCELLTCLHHLTLRPP